MSGNSWDNLYTKFIVLDIKFYFTFGEQSLPENTENCKNIFHLHFTSFIMIQISGNSPILVKLRKNYQNVGSELTGVEIFLISIFDLKQICIIVPTENCSIWNFPAARFVNNSNKSLTKASKLLRILREGDLTGTGTSYEQRFGFTNNQWLNKWPKVRK